MLTIFTADPAAAQVIPGYLQQPDPFIIENFDIIDSSGWLETLPGREVAFSGFLAENKQHFGMGPDDGFTLRRTTYDDYPFLAEERRLTHHRYQQTYKGLKVEFAELFLHHRNGRIEYINCKLAAGLNRSVTPALSEQQALDAAIAYFGAQHTYTWQDAEYEQGYKEEREDPSATSYPAGELLLAKNDDSRSFAPEQFTLAWKFSLTALDTPVNHTVYIDAHTGQALRCHSNAEAGNTNLSYGYGNGAYIDTWWRSGTYQHHVLRCDDANGPRVWTKKAAYMSQKKGGGGVKSFGGFNCTITFDPNKNCTENVFDADDNWGNDQLTTAHWAASKAWSYFKEKFNRSGYDGSGTELKMLTGINHAYTQWNKGRQEIWIGFYNGNNHEGTRDIVPHEFTHGVTQHTADLVYWTEFGALNESFSDIFGYEIERYSNGGVHTNWSIGEDAGGERNMNNPSQSVVTICDGISYTQPSVYMGANWYVGKWNSCDNGGVHINSGVQNYWFYLLSEGSAGAPDGTCQNIAVQGITADKAAQIAFYNLDNVLGQHSYHADARLGSLMAAAALFGKCSNEVKQVTAAWAAVGVGELPKPLSITGPKYIWYKKEPNGTVTIKGGMPKDYIATGGRSAAYSWNYAGPWTTFSNNPQIAKDRFRITDFNGSYKKGTIMLSDSCNMVFKDIYFIDYGVQQVLLHVAPNPVAGMLRLEGEFPTEGGEGPVYITISDGNGTSIYENQFENLPADIYLSDITPPGNYYLRARKGEHIGFVQLTKE